MFDEASHQELHLGDTPPGNRTCQPASRAKRPAEDQGGRRPSKTGRHRCPAESCADMCFSSRNEVTIHWNIVHQKHITLQLCNFNDCDVRVTSNKKMSDHLGQKHQLNSAQMGEVRKTVPKLAMSVSNDRYVDPGNVPPAAAPFVLPPSALPFSEKENCWSKLRNLLVGWNLVPAQSPAKSRKVVVTKESCVAECPPLADKMPSTPDAARLALPHCSTQTVGSLSALEEELLDIDRDEARLQARRTAVRRKIDMASGSRIRELETKVASLETRCQYLQTELKRARGDRKPYSTTVADLERIKSTRGMVLMPCSGATMVYPLKPDDFSLLDLENRNNLLSCDTL